MAEDAAVDDAAVEGPRLATFGQRSGGFFLDLIPPWLVVGTIAKLAALTPAAGLSLILLGWGLYNFVFLWCLSGQTPAMKLLGLVCVDEQSGEPLTVAHAAARAGSAMLIFAATLLGTFGLLGPAADLLWANWDPRVQTLHDKLAKTRVLKLPR